MSYIVTVGHTIIAVVGVDNGASSYNFVCIEVGYMTQIAALGHSELPLSWLDAKPCIS